MNSVGQILYVEDDEDTRELVSYVLTYNNFRVVQAGNYDDALQLVRACRFDLYLIDNWISRGSGIDLCKKIREINTSTPILFYSGAAYARDKQEAFAAGAQGYLIKPAENEQLIGEIARLISIANGHRFEGAEAELAPPG